MNELESVAQRLRENGGDFSSLEIQMNPGYEARDVQILTDAVVANHSLSSVRFFGILADDDVNEAVQRLVECFGTLPNLTSLKISGYCMDLFAVLARILHQRPRLLDLTLEYVALQGDFEALKEALRQHPCLQSFRIMKCQLPESLRDTNTLNNLLESLAHSPTIRYFSLVPIATGALGNLPLQALVRISQLPQLRHFKLLGFPCKSLLPVLEALVHSTSIDQLQLLVPLDGAHCRELGRLIQQTTALVDLQVCFSKKAPNIQQDEKEEHILELARALPQTSSLRRIVLEGRVFRKDTLQSFGTQMETNYSLTEFACLDNRYIPPIIDMYTKLNRQGRKELLQNEHATREDWIGKLIQLREDVESVYYYLSVNPSLCEDVN